ncbi:MAG TPA: hypothetical protein VJT49_18445 [Amycolatopsis sp.]|uniref:hypothetical protein n=1 Tax=Amycolatopsis sp. TaxID=37632 RepID=UPI002B4631F9|nr:hypothetical protein [Amycolatopsis sp.]HKS47049.1 hypothetical protein [Amycolatopsis sp.]
MREQITAITNKAGAFHGYSEWLMVGGKLIVVLSVICDRVSPRRPTAPSSLGALVFLRIDRTLLARRAHSAFPRFLPPLAVAKAQVQTERLERSGGGRPGGTASHGTLDREESHRTVETGRHRSQC